MTIRKPTKAERRRVGRSIRKARRERALAVHRDWMLTYRALEAAPERPIRGFSAAQVWHDEAQRYEATGRLDEGPCWCQECVQTELDRRETEQQT